MACNVVDRATATIHKLHDLLADIEEQLTEALVPDPATRLWARKALLYQDQLTEAGYRGAVQLLEAAFPTAAGCLYVIRDRR